ncbi:hypothetical protein ACQZ5N_18660 [Agrobacterium sp. 22-221-1]
MIERGAGLDLFTNQSLDRKQEDFLRLASDLRHVYEPVAENFLPSAIHSAFRAFATSDPGRVIDTYRDALFANRAENSAPEDLQRWRMATDARLAAYVELIGQA